MEWLSAVGKFFAKITRPLVAWAIIGVVAVSTYFLVNAAITKLEAQDLKEVVILVVGMVVAAGATIVSAYFTSRTSEKQQGISSNE